MADCAKHVVPNVEGPVVVEPIEQISGDLGVLNRTRFHVPFVCAKTPRQKIDSVPLSAFLGAS